MTSLAVHSFLNSFVNIPGIIIAFMIIFVYCTFHRLCVHISCPFILLILVIAVFFLLLSLLSHASCFFPASSRCFPIPSLPYPAPVPHPFLPFNSHPIATFPFVSFPTLHSSSIPAKHAHTVWPFSVYLALTSWVSAGCSFR